MLVASTIPLFRACKSQSEDPNELLTNNLDRVGRPLITSFSRSRGSEHDAPSSISRFPMGSCSPSSPIAALPLVLSFKLSDLSSPPPSNRSERGTYEKHSQQCENPCIYKDWQGRTASNRSQVANRYDGRRCVLFRCGVALDLACIRTHDLSQL